MLELTAILFAAAVVYGISRATRLPAIPLLILSGVALALSGAMPDREFVFEILEVGLVFLVFAAGMDMSPRRVGKQGSLALVVGLVQFGALGLIAGWLVLRSGYGVEESLYVALALSASSTLVVVRLLQQRRELFEPFGRMLLGVLLLQDLLVIGALVLLKALGAEDTSGLLLVLETTALLAVGAVVLGKWVLPRVVERYREEDETLLLIVLAVLFVFMGLSHLGGVPLVVGAFLAGLTLSNFPARALVRGLLSSLTDFFMVVFFISLGALVSVPSTRAIVEGLVVVGVVVVVTPLLVAWVAERAGMTSRGALEAGLMLAQTSEFSLIVGLLGMEQGVIDQDLFAVLLLVTVTTMILTPMISSRRAVTWLMGYHPSPGPKEEIRTREWPVVILGGGAAGSLLVDKARKEKIEVVVVDHDPMVVSSLRGRACDAVWGDADDLLTLKEAGVGNARAVIVTTGKSHHYEAARKVAPEGTPFWVHAFERSALRGIDTNGVKTVIYADAAAESFMDWYSRECRTSKEEVQGD